MTEVARVGLDYDQNRQPYWESRKIDWRLEPKCADNPRNRVCVRHVNAVHRYHPECFALRRSEAILTHDVRRPSCSSPTSAALCTSWSWAPNVVLACCWEYQKEAGEQLVYFKVYVQFALRDKGDCIDARGR